MNAHIGFGDALPRAFPTTVDSYLTFHGSVRQEATGPEGLIVVWQMCYPVQHVLDAAASMASSATFRGILLWAVSGCCYNNGGLRKHSGKGEWQTSVQSLPFWCKHQTHNPPHSLQIQFRDEAKPQRSPVRRWTMAPTPTD